MKLVGGHNSSEQKRKIEQIHVELELYSSLVELVVAMNDKVRKRMDAQFFDYSGIQVSLDKITQKLAIPSPGDLTVMKIKVLI